MPYNLTFKESALKEWVKLDRPIREQFKKKLTKPLERPRVEADRVSGMENAYKIKLRAVGLRLVYVVETEFQTYHPPCRRSGQFDMWRIIPLPSATSTNPAWPP